VYFEIVEVLKILKAKLSQTGTHLNDCQQIYDEINEFRRNLKYELRDSSTSFTTITTTSNTTVALSYPSVLQQ